MAERKSGPVKPPTIDLTARDKKPMDAGSTAAKPDVTARAAETKPAEKSDAGNSTRMGSPPESIKPKPNSKPGERSGGSSTVLFAGLLGAGGGAVIGLAAAYGLAAAGYWPGTTAIDTARFADSQALGDLAGKVAANAAARDQLAGAIAEARTKADAQIAALKSQMDGFDSAQTADVSGQIKPLADEVATLKVSIADLSNRLDSAVLSGNGDGAAAKAALASVNARLDGLERSVAADQKGVVDTRTGLETLRADLDTLKAQQASAAAAAPAVDVRLPLALGGLADAFASGSPFAQDLALVRAALPQLAVPEALTTASTTGLANPGGVVAGFNARVPEILAAKPAAATTGWSDQVFERIKALVALRPAGPVAGTSPEAVVSRIEAALADRDFAAAANLLGQLPDPMRAAASDIASQIEHLGQAGDFLKAARQTALASDTGSRS